MELVYVWFEELGTKKEQSINFNQTYEFKMEAISKGEEKTYKLTLKEAEKINKIPENYFGENISNVSCIIGENGSGKSTLMKEILEILNYSILKYHIKEKFKIKYLVIFKEAKDSFSLETNLSKNSLKREIHMENAIITYCNVLYFSSAYNRSIEFDKNISFSMEIDTKIQNSYEFFNLFNLQQDISIMRYIVNSTTEIIDLEEKIPFINLKEKISKMQKESTLYFYLEENSLDKTNINSNNKENQQEIFNKINIDLNNIDKKKSFKLKLGLKIWKNMINPECISDFFSDSLDREIKLLIDKKKSYFTGKIKNKIVKRKNDEDIFEWLEKQREGLKEIIENLKKELEKVSLEFWARSPKLIVQKDNYDIKFGKLIKDEWIVNSILLKIPAEEYFKNKELQSSFKYSKFVKFRFFPSLSSGEYTLLYLLAQIKEYFEDNKKILKFYRSVIFILEEVESFLHPEWQRAIIKLLNVIADIFVSEKWGKGKKIQFILTSHTPFLIGDLPKGNVKKMEEFEIKKIEKNPFGKNLLGILKDNFNLESLFSENIRSKIENLDKKLKSKTLTPEEENELKFLINNIDDSLLKTILESNYNQYKEERLNDKTKKY